MGFLDNLKKQAGSQFIEIIEWLDDSRDAMVYRFPVYNQEIKMGAQLVVRENQAALFVNEGKAADLFSPGRYELSTKNIPILTDLRGWKYGFQSPFKAEVYFFNTRLFRHVCDAHQRSEAVLCHDRRHPRTHIDRRHPRPAAIDDRLPLLRCDRGV